MGCPHAPYSLDPALCDVWLLPKVQMDMKGERRGLIRDTEAAVTAQLRTLTSEGSRAAWERGKSEGIRVFEARESILRRINGHVSFIVMILNVNIHHSFKNHTLYFSSLVVEYKMVH